MNNSKEAIGNALGRIPSGCSILTVQHESHQTGVLVSWVQQASFDPPAVTVCVKQGRPAGKLIDGAKRFMLNIIGDDPAAIFKHFGKGFSLEEDAFEGIEIEPTEFGPAIQDCIAHLGCEVKERSSVGDHDVYLAVIHAGSGDGSRQPYVHLRKSGLTY